jgi:DNA-directed RNA polymerase specialized sigma24 family protein
MTQAEALLADEYEGSKAEVQRTVAAKLGREGLAGVDLGAAYNEAWHALYLRLAADEPVDNRVAFLVTVTYRRALSERRASRPERLDGEADLEGLGVEPDIDARLDAELQLRHFIQGLRAELDERELQAATLTYLHGLSRPEAAKVIGIAPRRMEKVMDRASKRIAAVIDAVRPGELCEELDSPVRAFAVGLLDEEGERYAIARDHLATCPACRRKVLVLRGLGAIAPPLPGLLTGLGGAGALAGAAGAGAGGLATAGSGSPTGPIAAQAAAGKLALLNLGAKLAALSQKTVLIAGALTATTAVVVVGTVAVVGGGAGNHASGAPAPKSPAGRDFAGADDGYVAVPPLHPRRQEHRDRRRQKERHRRPPRKEQREQPAVEVAPETATAPEETYEAPAETYVEPTPEEATPTPTEAPEPSESTRPTTNAAVEFELH